MRINNIFGPTIQGEGSLLGQTSLFVRFQGCDSICPWCDTPQAMGTEGGEDLTPKEILTRLAKLGESGWSAWVTLSGGNPCLIGDEMEKLLFSLREEGHLIAVETQGTTWQDWLLEADKVVVSPKPWIALHKLFKDFNEVRSFDWKVIGFEKSDLTWAGKLAHDLRQSVYLQVGWRRTENKWCSQLNYLERAAKLAAELMASEYAAHLILVPQWHKLLWGDDPNK